jgi:hypothetical protein
MGVVYVLFVGALGLLWWEAQAEMTPTGHRLALLAIVLLFFGAVWVWLSWEERNLR